MVEQLIFAIVAAGAAIAAWCASSIITRREILALYQDSIRKRDEMIEKLWKQIDVVHDRLMAAMRANLDDYLKSRELEQAGLGIVNEIAGRKTRKMDAGMGMSAISNFDVEKYKQQTDAAQGIGMGAMMSDDDDEDEK